MLRLVATPKVTDRRSLRRYVAVASGWALFVAMLVDVASQLVFFISWEVALRSWLITIGVALGIAIPILNWIGRAQLALYQSKTEMERLSRTDPLTGLPNRRALLEAAEQPGPRLMILVILDIDHFKRVNDTLGHRIGDAVLRGLGQIMAQELAGYGTLGRLGGEEFALIATHHPPQALLDRLAGLRDRLAGHPLLIEGHAVSITLSAGAALRQDGGFDQLYSEADRALYAAKQAGRNRICLSAALQALVQAPRDAA